MPLIPFEPQQTLDGSRTCGAAALAMVYRSLGLDCRQEDIWTRVAENVRPGVQATRTRRLALDAIEQGLSAVILQARHPVELLAHISQTPALAILNHRLASDSPLGHYSVLFETDEHHIALHDPHLGPNRRIPWPEFDALWQPVGQHCEIVGRVLLAIGSEPRPTTACQVCGRLVPDRIPCVRCGKSVSLGLPGVVECVAADCPNRMWHRIFCPHCDWAEAEIPSA